MPEYIASGSHYFHENRYRFLILQRFKCDLHSVIREKRVNIKHILTIASQVLDVLEHLHDNGYAHNDIKAENLMIGSYNIDEYQKKVLNLKDQRSNDAELAAAAAAAVASASSSTAGSACGRPVRIRKQPVMDDFVTSFEWSGRRQLRPHKNVKYNYDDDGSSEGGDNLNAYDDDDADSDFKVALNNKGKQQPHHAHVVKEKKKQEKQHVGRPKKKVESVNHIFLIDFGLASKFLDSNGVHHQFYMDQRRAHDGTLEFTSRDAHMGAHSRRSDLECLGYNMMFWCLGTLPWKDEKLQNQPEQVHRMKEIFMTDAREMLRLIYGQEVPKFLGEYFNYVNSLAYDERPDYDSLRRMFMREFTQLGNKKSDMTLNLDDLKKSCMAISKTVKSADNQCEKIKNVKAIAKLGLLIPMNEKLNISRNSSIGCRISPKNLRSKTEKLPKKSKKRFSWAEILSQDPDQIARQRAEKEFERDQSTTDTPTKYKGRPTYAILEIENRLKSKDNNNENRNVFNDDDYIKGYTKAMMDVVRKRKASLSTSHQMNQENCVESINQKVEHDQRCRRGRRKSDNPTKLSSKTNKNNKNVAEMHDNFYMRPTKTNRKNDVQTHQQQQPLTPPNTTDESSCSSTNTESSEESNSSAQPQTQNNNKKRINGGNNIKRNQINQRNNNYSKKNGSTGTNSRSSSHSSLSISSSDSVEAYTTSGISSSEFFDDDDDDDDDSESYDAHEVVSPVKTRTARQKSTKNKISKPNCKKLLK